MTLIKFKQATPRNHGFPVFSELFNDLFENSIHNGFRTWNSPAANIIAHDDKYELHLAAPGLKKDDFKIDVDGDKLSIAMEKKEETNDKANYTHKEYHFAAFSRVFNLPEDVNTEAISASYEDGVLKLSIPRNAAEKPGKKEIKIS